MGADYYVEIYDPMHKVHTTARLCFSCCHQYYIRSREWLHPDRVPEGMI